jgi:outer membrane lipoprotein-sorting protein
LRCRFFNPMIAPTLACVLACVLSTGCAISKKTVVPPAEIRPAQTATAAQLIVAYDGQASAIRTMNAAVRMDPVAGSKYSGVIQQYHEVGGFILAARPAMIRVIGQAPVVAKDIFDMVSDGSRFSVYIPSKNKFLVGSTSLERPTANAIENLRPQHILDALFWPAFPAGAQVLFEEFDEPSQRYYVLTQLRQGDSGLEIARKVWFDRADLRVSRVQIYGAAGRLDSDIAYSNWQPEGDAVATTNSSAPAGASTAAASAGAPAGALFPRDIRITRPQQDYQLSVTITRLTLNSEVPADRFVLPQPPGTELVRVGENGQEAQP